MLHASWSCNSHRRRFFTPPPSKCEIEWRKNWRVNAGRSMRMNNWKFLPKSNWKCRRSFFCHRPIVTRFIHVLRSKFNVNSSMRQRSLYRWPEVGISHHIKFIVDSLIRNYSFLPTSRKLVVRNICSLLKLWSFQPSWCINELFILFASCSVTIDRSAAPMLLAISRSNLLSFDDYLRSPRPSDVAPQRLIDDYLRFSARDSTFISDHSCLAWF